ncbi:MAG: uncharacterized membrane protein YbhN (UPF0104 family) [Cellvibrionaceae bacterium]|jgi:uncharacterized membrane protein YbhN (UPF0104 family)
MAMAYCALTLYEVLGLRYSGVTITYKRAASTALLAYSVGHNVGIAFLSGGAMCYRMYRKVGLSATQIALAILFGTATFTLGAAL